MATFSQLPGTLNLDIVQGDSLSVEVDFDVALVSYTFVASIVSVVSGDEVVPVTTELTSAANGIVTLSLTAAQTAALPLGTYAFEMSWTTPAEIVRKVLSGFVNLTRR
jgi:hypothetical protein